MSGQEVLVNTRLSRVLTFLVFLALSMPNLGYSQEVAYDEDAERFFASGLTAYQAGDFRGAEQAFDAIVQKRPPAQRVTAAMIMRAKALLHLNESYEASKIARALLLEYPGSAYTPDAKLLLGQIYAYIERYDEARDFALGAWQALPASAPPSLEEGVRALVDTIIESHTTFAQLYGMIGQSTRLAERSRLWTYAAIKELARGNLLAASVAVDTITRGYSGFVDHAALEDLRLRLNGASRVTIGVLLPLMRDAPPSAAKEAGNEVYEGILAAYDLSLARQGLVRLTLDVRDTKRDVRTSSDEARSLGSQQNVVGVIGPVYSTTTTAAARITSASGLPLVTPTANQNGIAAIAPTVYQTNADYDFRGRAMALYASQQLGAQHVAVLAPSDTYGKFLADGFIKEAASLGIDVAVVAWYQKGASNLRSQLMDMRRAGFRVGSEPMISFAGRIHRPDLMKLARLGVSPARIDSLLAKSAIVPARWLLGPQATAMLDSVKWNLFYEEPRVDSLDVPVPGIQALYCPISSPEEIGVVSSQIVYYNFKAQVLGSGEWNSLPELEANSRYCSGVRFEADTYVDSNSTAFREFQSAYSARFKKKPGKNVLYGYDTASLLFSLVERGATTRESLARALDAVTDYPGVKGKIGLSVGRVNSWLHVLEYGGEGIHRVGEVDCDH